MIYSGNGYASLKGEFEKNRKLIIELKIYAQNKN
jgi:hypothetical protein